MANWTSAVVKIFGNGVEIAWNGGALQILVDILRRTYNKYGSFYFTDRASSENVNVNAAIHCLRIMVLNDESSRSKMVASENIRDILESLAAHPEAHETLNGAAAHILRDVPKFQNAAYLAWIALR